MTDIAEIKLPAWQQMELPPEQRTTVAAKVMQNPNYGGLEVQIGTLEIYIEHDAEQGICIRIWPDHDSGEDPSHTITLALADITRKPEV